ncbi:MAG: thiamine phosphate synthase [Planctomycetota bacterium]|nr:thiamine phosphate synthase [Planctomycetota bacterium]
MSASNRMADAAFNRAREGLRVLEDLARFVLNDSDRVEELKQARHDLTQAAVSWPGVSMVLSRDTAGDVGTVISTSAERCRQDLRAVASAAGRRATEALRSLEELAKVEAPNLAASFERMRYDLYDIAGGIEMGMPCRLAPRWRLCILLSETRCRRPWMDVAEAAIEGGADCVQLREKSLDTATLLDRARQLVAMARPRGVAVMINDRVDVALASGADGVHVGADDLSVSDVRRIAGSRLLVGATARTPSDIQAAIAEGASTIGIGPMFVSATKPHLDPVGPERLTALLPSLGDVPHLAIGGIDAMNVGRVQAAGGCGVAVCGGICDSDDPAVAAATLLAAIGDPPTSTPPSPEPVHGHA